MLTKFIHKVKKKIFPESKELLAAFLLQDLFHGQPFFPYTNSAVNMHSLGCIVNDIVINKRKTVVEFGAGISTVIISRAIKLYGLDTTLITVEENDAWMDVVKGSLERENLLRNVTFVHAPLINYSDVPLCASYDPTVVKTALANRVLDCVVIDGPSAWKPEFRNARVPVLNLVMSNLSDRYSIFIDNADRPGEQELQRLIGERLGIRVASINGTFAAAVKGQGFNFTI